MGPRTIRCPLCRYQAHCGHQALVGAPEPHGGWIREAVICLHCGVSGEQSWNVPHAERAGAADRGSDLQPARPAAPQQGHLRLVSDRMGRGSDDGGEAA
jgi:hypothetical protein